MNWTRKDLRDMHGYVPGEQPKITNLVKLNTNENPYPPSPRIAEALAKVSTETLRLYPDPESTALRQAASVAFGVPPEWIITGNGSDEVLAMLMHCALSPDDPVVMVYPTYSLYPILVRIAGGQSVPVDLNEDFSLPGNLGKVDGRILILSNPNPPIGTLFPLEQIEALCAEGRKIIAIDEAYADFAGVTVAPLLEKYDNLVVFRTMSKSYSLAGLRLGFMFCRGEILEAALKVKDSYNVNRLTQVLGIAALEDQASMKRNVERIVATRERLRNALLEIGFDVPPSGGNFLFATPRKSTALKVFQYLRERGILVRYFASRRLDGGIRITIGTDDEVDALLGALNEIF